MTFEVEGVTYRRDDLPEQFHEVVPFLARWALADENDREELQEAASVEELDEFVQTVEPLTDAIEAFVQSCADAPTPISILMARLLDCAIEASVELDLRPVYQENGY